MVLQNGKIIGNTKLAKINIHKGFIKERKEKGGKTKERGCTTLSFRP